MALVKRTRRKALKLCKALWEEVRDKGLTNKWEASIWKRVKTTPESCNSCFACEYTLTHNIPHCGTNCILSNVWPRGCLRPNSLFLAWDDIPCTTSEGRYDAANAIVQGCDESLKTLDTK